MVTAQEIAKEVCLTASHITTLAKDMPSGMAWKGKKSWLFSEDAINWIKKRPNRKGAVLEDKKVPERYSDCISYRSCLNRAAFDGTGGILDCNKCKEYQRNTEAEFIY